MKFKRLLAITSVMASISVHAQQQFALESVILDSQTSEVVGGGRDTAQLSEFFKIQKQVVFATLRDLGVDINALPLDVQAKLQRYHTTNFEAFQLFSQGLDAQDEGRFAEAKALFQQAIAKDPNFAMAGELVSAMPDTNVTGEVQLGAVLVAASENASTSGKSRVEVDTSGALAALQAGQNVVVGEAPVDSTSNDSATDFTSNEAGSGSEYATRKVVGYGFTRQSGVDVSVAATSEWPLDQVIIDSNRSLRTMGNPDDFFVTRSNAIDNPVGAVDLSDGSVVTWGTWQETPTGSFIISTADETFTDLAPEFQYMLANATTQMPTTGTVSFAANGGFLMSPAGNIVVDFANQTVALDALGFTIGNYQFSQLMGSASYGNNNSAGFFTGNYDSGQCVGCSAFSAQASSFSGNFVGEQANGLIFSTIMATGLGTAAGLELYTQD